MANQDAYRNYHHKNHLEDEPSEIPPTDDVQQHMNIHIEGEEDVLEDDDNDPDKQRDRQNRRFLEDLLKVGPFAKQILNYSYPPLLYQRGEGDEEDDEDEAVRDILEGGVPGLPDFDEEEMPEGLNNQELYRQIKKVVNDPHNVFD